MISCGMVGASVNSRVRQRCGAIRQRRGQRKADKKYINFLESRIRVKRFEDLQIPLKGVAARYRKRTQDVLSNGDLMNPLPCAQEVLSSACQGPIESQNPTFPLRVKKCGLTALIFSPPNVSIPLSAR